MNSDDDKRSLNQFKALDEWIADKKEKKNPLRKKIVMMSRNGKLRSKGARDDRIKRFPRMASLFGAGTNYESDDSVDVGTRLNNSGSTHQFGGCSSGNTAQTSPVFPNMIDGRGDLPTTDPPAGANWSIAKWKTQLDFLPFIVTSEIAMEEWFEDASFKIIAHGAKASTVIKVMQLMANPQLRMVLGASLMECYKFKQVEDIADSIAKRIFRGDGALEEYERALFTPVPSQSVFLAFTTYRRMNETYSYMCRRRERHEVVGEQQQTDIIFKILPQRVTNQIRRIAPNKRWQVTELFTFALDMEDTLTREKGSAEVHQVLQTQTTTQKDVTMNVRRCWACNGSHLRKDCPHRKDRCAKCGEIGHTSEACRSKVIHDTAGQRRMVAQPTQSGVVIETKFDNTIPSQLRTVAGVVERFLTTTDQERERARERYATKRLEQHPDQPIRTLPHREVLNTNNNQSSNSRGTYVNLTEEDCGLNEVFDVSLMTDDDIKIPKKRKLMNVSLFINSNLTNVCLDTGALMNCVSQGTAERLKIYPDKKGRPIPIKDVHGRVEEHLMSEIVKVSLNGTDYVNTRFALFEQPTRTILSLPTMVALDLRIIPKDNTIESKGITYVCNVVDVEEEKGASEPSTTIQQTNYTDIETAIELDSLNWDAGVAPIEKRQLKDLLKEYSDIWFAPKIGKCTTVTMEIKVNGLPRRVCARPTPVNLRKELNKQIDDLLAAKVILPCPDNKWVSACHLVPKPRSDKWRLVIDYRYVNTLVQDDGYQIPNVQDLLVRLSGASYFSLIDLNWGFWNVSLDESSRQYTGFVVPERGVFVWTVMPFGLKTSPTVFQRAIEKALRPLIDMGRVSVYIDDIIIFTISISEHLLLILEVFKLLRETGFFVNLAKAKFLRSELLYLGHIVSKDQLKPDPAKVKALSTASAPKDKNTLLSFCAAANYLRMFIPKFSETMEPLTRLTGKYVKFVWTSEQQSAFEQVKDEILNACYLTMPRWDRPFIIFTDASDVAVGAALAQVGQIEDTLEFIGFASKKFSETQRNWSPTERELYAIVWACEHYEQIIKGSRPLVYSDHASLEYLTNMNSPKVRRWALRLSEFNPVVTRIGGAYNNIADWLSRSTPDDDDAAIPPYVYVPTVYHLVHEVNEKFTLPKPEELIADALIEESEMPAGTLDWFNGVAYGRVSRRIYIPKRFRTQLMLWFHTSRFGGHQGITRTTNRMRKFVWWPNLQLSIVDFINACPICNAMKPLKTTHGEKGSLDRVNLFSLVSMDFIGPRMYGHRTYYVLVIVDHYSRFMVTVVLDTIATPAAENSLRDHWVSKFGAPGTILADRDPVFRANQFKSYVRNTLGSKLYYSSTEYPQGNGINESSHRILETAIRTHTFAFYGTIESTIADATLLYNVTPNRSIGDTPASLTFGCDLHIPGLQDFEPNMDEEARLTALRNYRGSRLLISQLNEIEDFSPVRRNRSATTEFKIGDIVTFKLSTAEREKAVHITNENKYAATRSFPHRVIKVTPKDLIMIPIWTKGKERRAPKEQCKLITTFIPELMREEAQQLYPSLPWLRASDETALPTMEPEIVDRETNEEASSSNQSRIQRGAKRFRPSE